MRLIPAIDLLGGRCVRLKQGRMDDSTIYGDDPVAMAGRWVEQGAERLHLVDLDGARDGKPGNADAIRAIAKAYPNLELEVGGGIRSLATAKEYAATGVEYLIVGTRAVKEPEFGDELCREFPGRVIISLDANNGEVAIDGWAAGSGLRVEDLALRFRDSGVAAILYTDIARDGMLTGVNVEATAALARSSGLPVIASGGVASLDDLRQLWAVREQGIYGAILGKALYEDRFSLTEAVELMQQLQAAS